MIHVHEDYADEKMESAYAYGGMDKVMEAFNMAGFPDLIDLEDEAYIRIHAPLTNPTIKNGNIVKNVILSIPDSHGPRSYLSNNFDDHIFAHKFHKRNPPYYVTEKQADKCFEDAVEITSDSLVMKTNSLDAYPAARSAFGFQTSSYGNYLFDLGIFELLILVSPKNERQPYINPIWFADVPHSKSAIDGEWFRGHLNFRIRGVKK